MRKIDITNWQKVNITDLFEIKRGSGKVTNEGKYPMVTATGVNNGIGGKSTTFISENCITASANGVNTGFCAYHDYKINVNSDALYLIPKFNITKYNGVFISVVMTKSFISKYHYGKKLVLSRLLEESIYLPFKNNQIDWVWIEEFMNDRKKEQKKIEASKPKYKTGKIDTSDWKSFKITGLFEIESGKTFYKKDLTHGEYPYVGSSSVNNGKTDNCNMFNFENIISLNMDGSVGYAFWHPYKLFLSDRCRALIPKFKYSDNICLFLCTIMTKTFTQKYNYGKKLVTKRLVEESVYLPEKNGEPDWEYMENFMNELIIE